MGKKLIYSVFILTISLAVPTSADLIGWWKMNDGAGNIFADSSIYSHNGTINPPNENNVSWTTDGYEGSALEFLEPAGPFTYVEALLTTDLLNVREATCSFWMNMPPDFQSSGVTFVLLGERYDHSIEFDEVGDFYIGSFTDVIDIPLYLLMSKGAQLNDGQWHHVVVTYSNSLNNIAVHLDGNRIADTEYEFNDNITAIRIGGPRDRKQWRRYTGRLDEAAVYNNVLSLADIRNLFRFGPEWILFAREPNPYDGAELRTTEITLSWKPGDTAVEHHIYVGENFDNVKNGIGSTDRGTTTELTFSNYPWEFGKTYFWRIDEIETNGTVHTGNIWSLKIATKNALNPYPEDGVALVEPDVSLSWGSGLGALRHDVYFGTDPDNLPLVAGGQTETIYNPGTLEYNTTYYWRVDEFDGTDTHTGELWSFKTTPDIQVTDPNLVGFWNFDRDENTIAVDWSGSNNHIETSGNPSHVTSNNIIGLEFDGVDDYIEVPQLVGYDFTLMAWINTHISVPGGITAREGSGLIWSHHTGGRERYILAVLRTKLAFETGRGDHNTTSSSDVVTGRWMHVAVVRKASSGDIELFINGVSDKRETHDGNAGLSVGSNPKIVIGANLLDSRYFRGIIDEVRIYNRALTRDEIITAMRGDLLPAWYPGPSNGAIIEIKNIKPLSWLPGDEAAQHDVYFGTDQRAVENVDASDTTGIYRSRQTAESYTPTEFQWDQQYYWRIDEFNNDTTITKGNVWSFKIADYLIVEDFEDYNDYPPDEVWNTWIDGFGDPTNGSTAGYPDPDFVAGEHYLESVIVHSGSRSMPLFYDNSVGLSEVTRTLTLRNWTEYGVNTLKLWYYGDAANAPEPMYVALDGNAVVTNDDTNAALVTEWKQWDIPLQKFVGMGVNLSNVGSITIGFGNKINPTPGSGTGHLFFDDIRLYR